MKSKYLQLQQLLLAHRKLSRQELIRLSGFNPRTVSRCLETFTRRQLTAATGSSSGISYELCSDRVEFAVFAVTPAEIFFILSDLQGIPRHFDRRNFDTTGMGVNQLITALTQEFQTLLAAAPPCAVAIDLHLAYPLHRRYCARLAGSVESAIDRPVFCRNNYDFLLTKYLFTANISGNAAALCGEGCGAVAAFADGGFADETAALWHQALMQPPRQLPLNHQLPLAEALDYPKFVNSGFPGFSVGKTRTSLLRSTAAAAAGGDAAAVEILTAYAAITAEALERIHQCGGAENYILLQTPPLLANMVRTRLPQLPVRYCNFTPNDRIFAACSFFLPQ